MKRNNSTLHEVLVLIRIDAPYKFQLKFLAPRAKKIACLTENMRDDHFEN